MAHHMAWVHMTYVQFGCVVAMLLQEGRSHMPSEGMVIHAHDKVRFAVVAALQLGRWLLCVMQYP